MNVKIAMQKIIDRLLNETDRHTIPENGHTKAVEMDGEAAMTSLEIDIEKESEARGASRMREFGEIAPKSGQL